AFKIITHPLTVVISFIVIVISDEQFGGFYLLYLLMGLIHGAIHSVGGFLGIALLLFSNIKSKQWSRNIISACVNLSGVILLWLSLFLFFYNDKSNYNISTLYQLLPQILLLVFLSISICFFVHNVLLLLKYSKNNNYKASHIDKC